MNGSQPKIRPLHPRLADTHDGKQIRGDMGDNSITGRLRISSESQEMWQLKIS